MRDTKMNMQKHLQFDASNSTAIFPRFCCVVGIFNIYLVDFTDKKNNTICKQVLLKTKQIEGEKNNNKTPPQNLTFFFRAEDHMQMT